MRIITGIQPSGIITLGNYLGSIKNFKKEVKDKENSFIFLANLHALTVTPTADELKSNVQTLAALYIAMGVNEVSNIFIQSSISEHAELAWILQCHTRNGELDRMTQYKDKSAKNITVSTGLYTYPILMAGDILLYKADYVPVGEDQKQHLELTRTLASRFNSFYKSEILKVPEPLIQKQGAKIFSLTDPTKKMSKSDENPKSFISMLDEPKTIEKKIKSATTDSLGEINFDPKNQPGVSNLLTIYSMCKNISMEETLKHFKEQNYGFLKSEVANAVVQEIEPIQKKYNEIIKNQQIMNDILEQGANKAREIAVETLKEIKSVSGLLYNE